MVNHDGTVLLNLDFGTLIKIQDIQYIEGGFELCGLESMKPLVVYFKNIEKSLTVPFISSFRYELMEALHRFITVNKKGTMLLLKNGYYIDMNEISHTVYSTDFDEAAVSPKIFFRDGNWVKVNDAFYSVLLDTFKRAMELDLKANEKKGS